MKPHLFEMTKNHECTDLKMLVVVEGPLRDAMRKNSFVGNSINRCEHSFGELELPFSQPVVQWSK